MQLFSAVYVRASVIPRAIFLPVLLLSLKSKRDAERLRGSITSVVNN